MGALRGRERPDRGKTCETGFERVSVKAMPEPYPVEGVATDRVGAKGKTFPLNNIDYF